MGIFLETDRLLLRQFTEADLDNLVELNSDPDVKRYISSRLTAGEENQKDLTWFIQYYSRSAGYGFWAAIDKSSGDFLGWFHFRPHEGASLDEPELGYRLRKSAWGKGYGTEGSRALIRKGFTELGVRRVVASTDADNIASRRVMEKAGLVFVRSFFGPRPDEIDGDDVEGVEYALERTAWEQRIRQEAESGVRHPTSGTSSSSQ
jgi:RimJ/RimL family protein N-acetyltransferase